MTYVKRRLWYDAPTSEREEIDEDKLLSRSESLVVLGEPGMGKSKLLQRLAEATTAADQPAGPKDASRR
jgi:hypothetical protein